jgi:hypothetical protein
MTSHHKGKSTSWTARVKSKKSGNRPQKNGKWGKAVYTVFSISIPSDVAQKLDLKPGDKTILTINAIVGYHPPKKKAR